MEQSTAVQVAIRVRAPPAPGAPGASPAGEGAGSASTNTNPTPLHLPSPESICLQDKVFTFDAVYPPTSSTGEIYTKSVRPLIQACLAGYNGCIFMYGQTSSGKTYTMAGPPNTTTSTAASPATSCPFDWSGPHRGLLPRVAEEIVAYVHAQDPEKVQVSVKASYLEIYQETLRDLLLPAAAAAPGGRRPNAEKLIIRQDVDGISSSALHVQGLLEREVVEMEDYLDLFTFGSAQRTVGETSMNDVSSRSHAVFTLVMEQVTLGPGEAPAPTGRDASAALVGVGTRTRRQSKIHLIDLAGSERQESTGATGARLKEGSAINVSLSALGNVIAALSSRSPTNPGHIPYRDSKLTYLLSDSLGGNSLTLMLACISPLDRYAAESVSTLRFAERAKKIQNVARLNYDPATRKILRLEAEVRRLRSMLGMGEQVHTFTQTALTPLQRLRQLFSWAADGRRRVRPEEEEAERLRAEGAEEELVQVTVHPTLHKVLRARPWRPAPKQQEMVEGGSSVVHFTLSLLDYAVATATGPVDRGATSSIPRFFQLPAPTTPPYYIKFLSAHPIQTNLPLAPRLPGDERQGPLISTTHAPDAEDCIVLPVHLAGSFRYSILHEGELSCSAPFYITIDPILQVSRNGIPVRLPLDSLTCLTIIPKWMPVLRKWDAFLHRIARSGYNMIHFAPVNERGISNSPYAIRDQLAISEDLFDPGPEGGKWSEEDKEAALLAVLARGEAQGIVSVTDVVWNHTSCDSPWLLEHPEAGYNLRTAPHLRPAFELDELIMHFSDTLDSHRLSHEVQDEQQLDAIIHVFKQDVLPTLRLWEFYVLHVAEALDAFERAWRSASGTPATPPTSKTPAAGLFPSTLRYNSMHERAAALAPYVELGGRVGHRYAKRVPTDVLVAYIQALQAGGEELAIREPRQALMLVLDELNLPQYRECDADLAAIVENVANRARFLRVAAHGPRLGPISRENPLVDPCFTRLDPQHMDGERFHADDRCLANNGWIWNADPLVNFAAAESKAYLRREVIAWGDCVKLRYESGPEDNPWLWEHMGRYTCKMARLFRGFRIDNCHSTPIHVARHFLQLARQLNPNLYVFAELFTGSQEKDVVFVSRLGIHSLIREAMNAWDTGEMSRLAHRMGGRPIGSFLDDGGHILAACGGGDGAKTPEMASPGQPVGEDPSNPAAAAVASPILEVPIRQDAVPHNLFMDCTHDNETPSQKRTAPDALANSAIVAFSHCAVGSVQGYDELVPELLDIVNETRKYRVPAEGAGIVGAKRVLNRLHESMAAAGYHEVHVHQEGEYIVIHRAHPITHDGYLLIARTAFRGAQGPANLAPVALAGQTAHPMCGAILQVEECHAPSPEVSPLSASPSVFSLLQIAHELRQRFPSHLGLQVEAAKLAPPEEQHGDGDGALSPLISQALFHGMPGNLTLQPPTFSHGVLENAPPAYIEGLPSKLKLSVSTAAQLASVAWCPGAGAQGEGETRITIDTAQFLPGSIVIYRTQLSGEGAPSASGPAGSWLQVDGTGPSRLGVEVAPALRGLWDALAPLRVEWLMSKLGRLSELPPWFSLALGAGTVSTRETEAGSTFCPPPALAQAVQGLGIAELNVLLYKSHQEELDSIGTDVYDVPGYGPLVYAGLQGFLSMIAHVAERNELSHPFCENLRQGLWMLDYLNSRLEQYVAEGYPALEPVRVWLDAVLGLVRRLPRQFVPKYLTIVLAVTYHAAIQRAGQCMPGLHAQGAALGGRAFLDGLRFRCALTGFQLLGRVKSTGLCSPLFPAVSAPVLWSGENGDASELCLKHSVSLAAGLPHFSTNFMRCWGRDIFTSLRGLLLLPGHFDVARAHLLACGSTLKHGLIPNLLDQGIKPRYNARDAVWWWLYSVGQYIALAPEGPTFLNVRVARRFVPLPRYQAPCQLGGPWRPGEAEAASATGGGDAYCDVGSADAYRHHSTVRDLCQEVLERHACGISFVEWNAGPALDHAMGSEGFRVDIHLDAETGFVHGGNRHNCGTWMDKMGDSAKAGTRGVPATPRDGAAVEITGLLKHSLAWIQRLPKAAWPYEGVWRGSELLPYAAWGERMQRHFEPSFHLYPPRERFPENGRAALGIYRDTVGSSLPHRDSQLRPNLCIAMVVAPELFDPAHARATLQLVRSELLGPLGMRTLEQGDWSYRGWYDNGNDSEDGSVAHGFNYHQGPEWLWLTGFFLRAYLHFFLRVPGASEAERAEALPFVHGVLRRHAVCLQGNSFAGLPELTNQDGAPCPGSCPSQAWSSAVMAEAIREVEEFLALRPMAPRVMAE